MTGSPARIDALEPRQLLTTFAWGIDSSLSSLKIDVKAEAENIDSINLNGLDTANFEGTLKLNITGRGVVLSGGSSIRGIAHEGDYAPGGGDAVYAVDGKYKKVITLATVKAAVRDITLDIKSDSRKAIEGPKRRFAIYKGHINATDGTVDYNVDSKFGDASGTKSISGNDDDFQADIATAYGRITGSRGHRIVTIPVSVTYDTDLESDIDGTFSFTGQIVAREDMTAGQSLPQSVTAPAIAARFSSTPVEKAKRAAEDVLTTL